MCVSAEERMWEIRREEFYKNEIEEQRRTIERLHRELAEQRAATARWQELASKYLVTREVTKDDALRGRLMISNVVLSTARDVETVIHYEAAALAKRMIKAWEGGVG